MIVKQTFGKKIYTKTYDYNTNWEFTKRNYSFVNQNGCV